MLIGYARVSTDDQSLSLQHDALTKVGCKRIFTDKASSAPTQRPGLADALSHLRKGDSLIVWKLDRLGRSVKGLVDLVAEFETRQVHFRSLTEPTESTPKPLQVGFSFMSWPVSHKWSAS
jgi:DNA invertase Pin-like site-specific DNA recombinase